MFEEISLAWPFAAPAAESEIDLAALVDSYSTLLFRVANSVVRNASEAEDVVQDVFVRVLQHRGSLPNVRDMRVWLVRIAWNLSIDRQRGHRAEPLEDGLVAQLHAANIPADKVYAEAQRLRVVLDAMEHLPAAERQVLCLSAMEELDTAEIASVMSKTQSAVRTLLFRARTRLRERLSKKGVR